MKIKLKETIEQDQEFEVEFPIYREHAWPEFHVTIYTRIEENLKAVHIEISGEYNVEVTVVEKYRFDGSCMDYHLGRGTYKSSKQDFDKALKKARELIDSIRPT